MSSVAQIISGAVLEVLQAANTVMCRESAPDVYDRYVIKNYIAAGGSIGQGESYLKSLELKPHEERRIRAKLCKPAPAPYSFKSSFSYSSKRRSTSGRRRRRRILSSPARQIAALQPAPVTLEEVFAATVARCKSEGLTRPKANAMWKVAARVLAQPKTKGVRPGKRSQIQLDKDNLILLKSLWVAEKEQLAEWQWRERASDKWWKETIEKSFPGVDWRYVRRRVYELKDE